MNLIVVKPDTGYIDVGVRPLYYKLAVVDVHGNAGLTGAVAPEGTTVDVPGSPPPVALWLAPGSPNPARGTLLVRFRLPRAGPVSLGIYDPRGRLVRELVRSHLPAGEHAVQWDLRDSRGVMTASGLCLVRGSGRRGKRSRVGSP